MISIPSALRITLVVVAGLSAACGDPSRAPALDARPDAGGALPDAAPADGVDASDTPSTATNGPRTEGDAGPTSATALGLQCAQDADCGSGHCADGVCCDSACDGVCQSCASTGKLGVCAPVVDAFDDTCSGASICDSAGVCRKDLGRACLAARDCASGSCVDGVCCDSAACGTCQSCGLPGSLGRCAPVPRLSEDADSACLGGMTCNGLGACVRKNGQPCAGAADCASTQCVDGVCCETACDASCYACNVDGKEGACAPLARVEDPVAATPCSGSRYCGEGPDDAPVCLSKLADGMPCTFAGQCTSSVCGTYYVDADHDGYGASAGTFKACGAQPPAGASAVGGDCCDSAATVHPGVTDYSPVRNACGTFDFDCNGVEEAEDRGPLPCGSGSSAVVALLTGNDTRVRCR